MISILSWFTPDTIRALGWTLVHFLWQGAVLAILLYAVTVFSRNALARYTAAVSTLAIMVCCPVATFLVLRHQPESTIQPMVVKQALGAVQALTPSTGALPVSTALSLVSVDWMSWFVSLWFVGVLLFGIRALGGWVLLERLHREKSEPLSANLRQRCLALQQRMGLQRSVRYLQSRLVDSPAVTGWFRPVVLLPVTALTGLSAEQLEAVILHELAHIKRFDAFVNLFQIAVETVLFYHPAIWWVSGCIRAERENCCDDVAVAHCGNACNYARALTLMESWRATPALVLAANSGSLKSRISRLLGLETITRSVPRGGLATIGLLCAAGALVAGTFNVRVSHLNDSGVMPPALPRPHALAVIAPASLAPEVSTAKCPRPQLASLLSNRPATQRAVLGDFSPVLSKRRLAAGLAMNLAPIATAEVDQSAPEPPTQPSAPEPPPLKGSYIDGLESAGIKNISVDDLIALKIQGVTPEYVRDMRATGLNPNVHDLIAMKVQGITPDYVRKARSSGWNDVTLQQIIAMKVQGVEPGDAAEYRNLGLKDLTLNQLIAFRVQGVTPNYIRAMQSAGFTNLNAHDYISAKIQGVTPEFIQKVHSHGFTNLSLHQLIGLKMADVF